MIIDQLIGSLFSRAGCSRKTDPDVDRRKGEREYRTIVGSSHLKVWFRGTTVFPGVSTDTQQPQTGLVALRTRSPKSFEKPV
jgi:hypothetical protein